MHVIDFSGIPVARSLDVRWIHGSESAKHNTDPDIQVYAYDEHTFILRQNMAINYEAPFVYLLFGNERAVLIDTGATESAQLCPMRDTVDDIMDRWLARHPREAYELLVIHSHTHPDHVAGDGQFKERAATTIIEPDLESVRAFFGLSDDLDEIVQLDLGGRVLDLIASPGHDEAAITYYDRYTGVLLTGDTVYPGRLYVVDWLAFAETIDRLIRFCETRPVTHILGCHIEMSTKPGIDYKIRTTYQPNEPPLELPVEHLGKIRDAIREIDDTPGIHVFPEFLIYHGIPDHYFGYEEDLLEQELHA